MIVLAIIAVLFSRQAKELGLNNILWPVLGILTYLGSQFLVGIALGLMGVINEYSVDDDMMGVNIMGIVIALLFVVLLYRYMVYYAERQERNKQANMNEDLLDDDLFSE